MSPPTTTGADPSATPILALSGTVLESRYELGRVLGLGGMGAVFEARHLRLDRTVAIKVLRPVFVGHDEYVKRFLREAKIASRIKHRNVVEIHDYGEAAGGLVYSVMELLHGQDLDQYLQAQPGQRLPWPQACGLLAQIASGLRAAHAVGAVHRDIKPANCFLTADEDGQPLIKVVDFGIAKIDDVDQSQRLTANAGVLGTPSYIAPEIARLGAAASPRSDIYSLGVLAYRMLTGRLPFTGATAFEILRRSCFDPVPSMREQLSDLPVEVEELILQMLAKEPDERPLDMQAVRTMLLTLGGVQQGQIMDMPGSSAIMLHLARSNTPSEAPIVTPLDVLQATPQSATEVALPTPRAAVAIESTMVAPAVPMGSPRNETASAPQAEAKLQVTNAGDAGPSRDTSPSPDTETPQNESASPAKDASPRIGIRDTDASRDRGASPSTDKPRDVGAPHDVIHDFGSAQQNAGFTLPNVAEGTLPLDDTESTRIVGSTRRRVAWVGAAGIAAVLVVGAVLSKTSDPPKSETVHDGTLDETTEPRATTDPKPTTPIPPEGTPTADPPPASTPDPEIAIAPTSEPSASSKAKPAALPAKPKATSPKTPSPKIIPSGPPSDDAQIKKIKQSIKGKCADLLTGPSLAVSFAILPSGAPSGVNATPKGKGAQCAVDQVTSRNFRSRDKIKPIRFTVE